MRVSRLLLVALGLLTCGPQKMPEVVSDVRPLLAPDARFFETPFPQMGRLRDDGTIDLTGFATKENQLAAKYVNALQTAGEGFGRNAGIWFPLSGGIEVASLPATPGDSASFESAAYLVNVDEASVRKGEFIPVEVQFKAAAETYSPANLLVMVPSQGHVLQADSWYGAVLTKKLKDSAGVRLARAAFLDDEKNDGPRGSASRIGLKKLNALLKEKGRDETEVIAATVYRTGTHAARLKKIADAARAFPAAPVGAVTVMREAAEFVLLKGEVTVPLFQRGEKPYLDDGQMLFDATGAPIQQSTEVIRFAVSVPKKPMPAGGYPLLFHVPGSGGDWLAIFDRGSTLNAGLARELAARGIAAFGIEANLTGPRHPSGDLSGFHFYNIFNPISVRDNHRQHAAEYEVLAHLAASLRLAGTLAPLSNATQVSFDASKFYLHGHSTGSVVGASILAQSNSFQVGALSGAGGSWLYNLVLKETPASAELTKQFLAYKEDDAVDIFDPIVNFASAMWDPIEPMNQAQYWARDSALRGDAPASVLLIEGVKDTYYLPRMVAALAMSAQMTAAEGTVEPLLLEGLATVGRGAQAAPFRGNVMTSGKTVTLGVVQHAAGTGKNGHFVVFDKDDAKYQYGCFFESAAKGQVPVVAPKVTDRLAACPIP